MLKTIMEAVEASRKYNRSVRLVLNGTDYIIIRGKSITTKESTISLFRRKDGSIICDCKLPDEFSTDCIANCFTHVLKANNNEPYRIAWERVGGVRQYENNSNIRT